jgi:predicted MFS family arabinose efflux permease
MQPFWGLLSDRFGRLTVMRLGLGGAAVAGLASAIAPNLASIIVARALSGAFFAAVFPAALVYIGDVFPLARRQAVIADLLAATAIGTTVGSLGAGLLGQFGSWRLAFGLPALLGGVLAVVLARLAEPARAGLTMTAFQRLRLVLRSRWAVFVILLAFGEGAIMFGFFTYFAPALEAHGVEAGLAGLVVASYGVAVLLMTQVMKRLATSGRPVALIMVGGLGTIAGYGIAASNQQLSGILAGSALLGLGFVFLHSSLQTWATDVTPAARGTAVAFFAGAAFVGGALSTALVAPLAGNSNYILIFVLAAGMAALVTLLAALGRARYRASEASVEPAP